MSRFLRTFLILVLSIVSLSVQGAPLAAASWQTDAELGTEVSVLGPDGAEVALVSVTAVQDAFELYDPRYPPLHGYHYVLIEVFVEATGSRTVQFDPNSLVLRDTDGFLYSRATIYRAEGETAPDFAYAEVASGSSVAGAIGFQVLNGVTIADIWMIPASDQLIQLVEFVSDAPAMLDDVPLVGHDGSAVGVTILRDVVDPFEGYNPDYGPDRASRYSMVILALENTGVRPMEVDPNDFLIQDTEGFLYSPRSIVQAEETALPELVYIELAPGDVATGVVGFTVLAGVDLHRILYRPTSDRLLTLFDFEASDSNGQASVDPTADPGSETAAVDCDEVGTWLTRAHSEASAAFEIMPALLFMRLENDPDYASFAGQVSDAFAKTADDLTSLPAPASVEELNQQLAEAFSVYGEATGQLVTADESGDQVAIDEAAQAAFDAEPALINAILAVGELADACGIEVSE